ncbi:hypothetical protein P885DRAFT_81460 [Corynascus similis CBS 632.67]
MAVSIRIEPSDFVVPTGPAVVFIKVDREAFRHLAPSMNPLLDADSISTVLRKGKPAIAYAIRQLSDMLFGDDIEQSKIRHVRPQPDVPTTLDSEPLLQSKYVCFYWLRHIPAGEHLPSALVELTSASEPVDNYLDFHAVEATDEDHKVRWIAHSFSHEELLAKEWGQDRDQNQAQAQAQAHA